MSFEKRAAEYFGESDYKKRAAKYAFKKRIVEWFGGLAFKAMAEHKYSLATSFVKEVPEPWGTDMELLIIEHEMSYLRSKGKTI